MSKIRLHGSSSGYTEIAPVAASGNNTLTLPNDGTIISKDSNGAVGVTSITVGTGVTIGDGRVTCSTLHGSAANCTQIPAANIVGLCTAGFSRTGGFGGITDLDAWAISSNYDASSGSNIISANWYQYADRTSWPGVGSEMTESSGVFTFPSTGLWMVTTNFRVGIIGTGSWGLALAKVFSQKNKVSLFFNTKKNSSNMVRGQKTTQNLFTMDEIMAKIQSRLGYKLWRLYLS